MKYVLGWKKGVAVDSRGRAGLGLVSGLQGCFKKKNQYSTVDGWNLTLCF